MKTILRRLDLVEKEAGIACTVSERERVIVILYPNGDEAEYERLLQIRIAELREKYGSNINEDDLLVIGIRKFCCQDQTDV